MEIFLIILLLFLPFLLIGCVDCLDEKVINDENLRKKEGYKWYVGSFENLERNTLYTIAFVAKTENQLYEKVNRLLHSKTWKYDGIIPLQQVREEDLWRVENAAYKY